MRDVDTIAGFEPPPVFQRQEPPVSQINVVLVHEGAREDQAVTAGTKAWELFQETPEVIAARVGGELRDLAHELAEGDEVERVDDRQRRRPRHPASLHRARDGPGGAGPVPGRQARHRSADRERLLLRLRRRDPVRARGPREDRDPDAQDRQGEPALLAPAGLRRRRARRAGRRALQAGADRPEGFGG